MGTNTGTIMTLANSIIGVSVLAMPFCFKQCGIALSILMLIASSLLSRLACHFLLKSAVMARRRTFEFLAFHTFGLTGKFTVELFIIGFLMGTCIAFFVVMGDLGPAIVAKILGLSNTAALRPSVLIGLAIFVVLPLGMLRNVDSLSSVSMATIAFYICLVLKVVGESLPHLLAGDWYEHVYFWRPAGILQCIPIFSMALFCQTQLFEIYETMHNASLDRMNFVIRAACNICTGVYICVGFFGYIAFCTQPFTGNVLMSFTPSIVSEMIKLGFVLSVAVSFPLVIFPCRASLYSLLFRRITMPHHEGVGSHIPEARFKCLTVFIICVALVIGLLIPNIELVLGLVGSTIGVLICVMFPAAAFICMSTKSSSDRMLAQVLLFVGALILVLGTYATLNSANETKPAVELNMNEVVPENAETMPHFHEKVDNSLADIPPKLEQKSEPIEKQPVEGHKETIANVMDVKASPVQPKEVRVDSIKADKRQEPPVPVEPVGDILLKPTVASIPKEEKSNVKESMKEADITKDEPEQKKAVKSESEKQEAKPAGGEQVHQDAIKKEDEELAEAAKRGDVPDGNKNEEILRKLEKHEAQQMKILQEQKQILQALQEHQERELFKEQQDTAEKKVVANKKTESVEKKKIEKQNIQEEVNEEVKAVVSNAVEKEIPLPQKRKQDLLQQIANGELKKPIAPAPAKEKMYQITEKPINNSVGNVPTVADIKAYRNIPALDVKVEPEINAAPAQPIFLERLKSPPLPLAIQNKNKGLPEPQVVNEKIQGPASEIKAMRREILQEPVPSTQISDVEVDAKNISFHPKRILDQSAGASQLHDREKRDIESTEKINVDFNDGLDNTGSQNISDAEKMQLNQENCHRTEKSVDMMHSKEMYKKHNSASNIVIPANQDNINPVELPRAETVLPFADSETKDKQAVKSAPLVVNSSKEEKNVLIIEDAIVNRNNHSLELQSVPKTQDIKTDSEMIKSITHLSNPYIKSKDDVPILMQSVPPDAKPMKRDLKSISMSEDKESNYRKRG